MSLEAADLVTCAAQHIFLHNSLFCSVSSPHDLRVHHSAMEILASVRERAMTADETSRKAIIDQLNQLARELETPQDCMQRILYQVCNPAFLAPRSKSPEPNQENWK